MTIETKLELGNEVWVMHNNKPQNYTVWSIEPVVYNTPDRGYVTQIRYRLEDHGKYYDESDLFKSKEELIKSL